MTAPAQPLQPLPYDLDIAPAAALIADPTRAAILRSLLPGRPLAAGELARLAGVSAATGARAVSSPVPASTGRSGAAT